MRRSIELALSYVGFVEIDASASSVVGEIFEVTENFGGMNLIEATFDLLRIDSMEFASCGLRSVVE